ncbi:hypothetical protein HER10_EVM0003383 [Colletotrichum scovillei]|uniref:uncharacterized protein n=1 Tax=Colletotrichum scovillei TaxID=1209932 RepID=UPI0015C3D8E9|nr:uncharacterized protein HER10_EVM0003383 [Colletotrichum scovillei]KAF4785170.1 hypothetical protein HER10_EVM0003383 [Colletotrichum scovillei]
MKFATVLGLLSLATAVTAKHYCFGGCVNCNHNAYKSDDPNNKQGNCDQPGGFHLGCGRNSGGKCKR